MKDRKGFTLIELIMVTIILGILAAVAVPRYMGTVNRTEAAAEDAVLSVLKANAEASAMEAFMDTGRKYYPANPFDGASVDGYTIGATAVTASGDWAFDGSHILHMRNDDSIWSWSYSRSDDNTSQADDRGSFGSRSTLAVSVVGGDAGGPVYVDHVWCGSYCYDLAGYGTFENIPQGWWTNGEPVEECDCSS
jgi:prepilin-type N-terminal cleavage/methylation domain-containing protein